MEHLNMESNYYSSQIRKIICRKNKTKIHFSELGHMKMCSQKC